MRMIYFRGVFTIRITLYDFIKIVAGKMSSPETQLNILLKRLDEAEKKSNLLKLEIKSIRSGISNLRHSLTGVLELKKNCNIENGSLVAQSVSKRTRSSILLDTLSDDEPSQRKRFKDETDNKGDSFVSENGYVIVYTDGACENNGKPNAKAGIGVWFGDNNPLNISKAVVGKATNNTAEIQACIEALTVLQDRGKPKVKIRTDSQFTINCMTQWINNWKRNNWKTASGGPVKNKIDLQKLDLIVHSFQEVKFEYVAGHKGNKGNEEADKLARKGATFYR